MKDTAKKDAKASADKLDKTEDEHVHDEACHKKHKQRHLIALVTLLFLLGGLTAISALYISSANTVSNKNEEISSLLNEVNELKLIDKGNSTDRQDLEPLVGQEEPEAEEDDSDTSATSQLQYTADLAEFELTLDESFGIYEELDAPFEGPGATVINVAKKIGDQAILDVSYLSGSVKISGYFTEENGGPSDLVSQLTNNGGEVSKQPDTTFAGQSAEVYLEQGFGSRKNIFFSSGQFQYRIEYNADATDTIFEAVEAGFSLN